MASALGVIPPLTQPVAEQLARLSFCLQCPDAELMQFVAGRFAVVHGAELAALMPWQAVLRGAEGQLLASVGLRLAAGGPLYLEHYLDAPIEQQLATRLQQQVDRAAVLELGNLAARQGMARLLILAMVAYLNQQQFRYVTFTATRQVQAVFHHLGLSLIVLAPAQSDRIADAASWGRYYENSPQVMAGSIAQGWQRLQCSALAPLLVALPGCQQVLAQEGCS